jgi:hypothetical protein
MASTSPDGQTAGRRVRAFAGRQVLFSCATSRRKFRADPA